MEEEGTVNAPIGRHPTDRKKMAINEKNGKPAVTHYKVLERFDKYTYIECQLEKNTSDSCAYDKYWTSFAWR